MTTCSADARAVDEPLAGTAPHATAWIVIEQPGPWGRDALLDSHLDQDVAAHLAGAKGTGVSVVLARHPDRPERAAPADRQVWVARCTSGGLLLRHGRTDDLRALLSWDLAAIGRGHLPAFGHVNTRPVTFICTHSGRDRCCAVEGRGLITSMLDGMAEDQRSTVWECSHVGGHRFAPVALSLPLGAVLGRLDPPSALELVDSVSDGRVPLEHLRGRSALIPAHQAAAIAVLELIGDSRIDDVDVLRVIDDAARPLPVPAMDVIGGEDVLAEVRHVDGRAWRVEVQAEPLARPRLESCGKEAVPGHAWRVTSVREAPRWR